MGSGHHLITNVEWTSLARHIAAQPSKLVLLVPEFFLEGIQYSASTTFASDGFINTQTASNTGTLNYIYNTSANIVGSSGEFTFKRIHNLSNRQIIWDLAGNIYEWNDITCIKGSGMGKWYDIVGSIDWNNNVLDDYKRDVAGPLLFTL
ncbi:MAG: hypothetical protein BWY21_01144 [Parcubacteria group bacterium ADurb.Bin216]|nr:MAG: hypothetical protein BWY21_01144 [Parcubacteria group bacterium ADurb.Bin216]